MVRVLVCLLLVAGCARGRAPVGPVAVMRDACVGEQRWDGTACVARGGSEPLAEGAAALVAMNADGALAAMERAAAFPLDHRRNIILWETRGIAEAYLEREPAALAAFDRLLALDPDHIINYQLTTRAIWLYQSARDAAAARGAPRLEVKWRRDQALGRPVPLSIDTVADPTGVLKGGQVSVYVRTRGETAWRAADVALAPAGERREVVLPGLAGRKPRSLELYAVASDAKGNEVLTWASASRPSEIALRYDPPWYRTWWVWAIAGGVVAAGTGVVVYATVWEPGSLLGGVVSID